MENNLELILINRRLSEQLCDSKMRAEVLQGLTGLKYWLFLFGL